MADDLDAYAKIRVDFTFMQGDDIDQLIRFGSDDEPDLVTGDQFRLMLKSKFSDPPNKALANLTTENSGIVYDGTDGIRFLIAASISAAFTMPKVRAGVVPSLTLFYDLERIRAGKVKKAMAGKITFFGEVTN